MRFNFEIPDNNKTLTPSPPPAKTPPSSSKEQIEWIPLKAHPILTTTTTATTASGGVTNLIAYDKKASRLYFWESHTQYLHRLSIRLGDSDDPTLVLASSTSKVLQPDVDLSFGVSNISINRNGSALLLSGDRGFCVMYLFGRNSTTDNTIICRTVSVGSQLYYENHNSIRALQISWHPSTDTHLGILSSDSVFRLFDLSLDLDKPEQEYYLQPVEPERCRNAASICPVGFSFGGEHLWDRFTVFILFSDGSIYILCPVVPFGSVYRWDSIWEIYNDAQLFGLKASNPRAVSYSSLAIAWLQATFPQLASQPAEGGSSVALRAHPYVPFDASLTLQGPLRKVCHGDEEESELQGTKCEGRAVGFLYNIISKDSILVTAWSSGQLQIDALADEIQPVWNVGNPPRICVDSHDNILGVAMICESIPGDRPVVKLDQPLDHTVWLGNPPPLLSLAVVDLSLPKHMDKGSLLSMFADPFIPERIYCLHGGGVDSIVIHFLPFTSQASGKDEVMKPPSVYQILSTAQRETSSSSALCGVLALEDSFGFSWLVAVTSSEGCVVLETKDWNILLPIHHERERNDSLEEFQEKDTPGVLSKELLDGPNVVLIPQASPNLRALAADSIEGRSALHQYCKLFHENYVEYAHKVWFELRHHGAYLKEVVDNKEIRLRDAHRDLLKVEERQPSLDDRINRALEVHESLEGRLQALRNLPRAHKKPLSRAELDFKTELDRFTGLELDALRASIESLNARARKFTQPSQGSGGSKPPHRQFSGRRKNPVPESQVSQLRSAVEKLSLVNSETSKKVKLVESALSKIESNE
ncbi:hypothetical protein MKW94_006644 [Papaver nudicaule]|uniref:Nuclear pore complex protein NUP88 n=1 Tax=Papaver nudicaule TaxID=74823 RepID=A0AA41S0F2_PAPNU|nr:hypothetical protein [Papaver nudicaule]